MFFSSFASLSFLPSFSLFSKKPFSFNNMDAYQHIVGKKLVADNVQPKPDVGAFIDSLTFFFPSVP